MADCRLCCCPSKDELRNSAAVFFVKIMPAREHRHEFSRLCDLYHGCQCSASFLKSPGAKFRSLGIFPLKSHIQDSSKSTSQYCGINRRHDVALMVSIKHAVAKLVRINARNRLIGFELLQRHIGYPDSPDFSFTF